MGDMRVTQQDRKIYLFPINELEGEFESSPGRHSPYFSRVTADFEGGFLVLSKHANRIFRPVPAADANGLDAAG
jgi:hypothetical protein